MDTQLINYEAILMMALTFGVPIVIAITFHEAAHGFAAYHLGDATAKQLGRVTLNPIKHIDPMGTIVIPAFLIMAHAPFLFGYAKPVPVNFNNLRKPRRDMILVAAAGPGTNFLLALLSALLFKLAPSWPLFGEKVLQELLYTSFVINIVLGIFNMIPFPPLDGGRVAIGLLPPAIAQRFAKLEPYGFFILISVMVVLPLLLKQFGIEFSPFSSLLKGILQYINL